MNKKIITERMIQAIWACENALTLQDDEFLIKNETRLKNNLIQVADAFSGSWIGYHANIYYRDFQTPLPGDHFSSEWGLMPRAFFSDSIPKNWVEYPRDEIRKTIMTDVHSDYQNRLTQVSNEASKVLEDNYETVRTILDSMIAEKKATALKRINDDIIKIDIKVSASKLIDVMRPNNVMTRDSTALSQGLITPVHCIFQAEQIELLHPFKALKSLTSCANRILKYMEINNLIERNDISNGNKVFIGHGRSPLWRELKDFIQDRLHLEWEEFNREPTAGFSTAERLQQMLDSANFALLVMTAEDKHADATKHARENVIHEVGLFQGRFSFRKAIVVLEEGCTEFSNITGLSQIRFPKGNITACFEDIRMVLEREGFL